MNMGRNRNRRNATLPPNLYENGGGYYTYRHPRTGKKYGMGKDRQAAIIAAKHLNSELAPVPDLADRILAEPQETFADFIDWFEQQRLPTLKIADSTRRDYRQKLPHIRTALGNIEADAITVAHVARFLDQYPATQSNRYRALISILFKHAIARGLCETNPATATLKREETIQRARLTFGQFQAIRQHAPAWLKNAMDLALKTLQRRSDLAALKWEQVKDGYIWIQQQKVERHGSGNLKIRITPEIKTVLDRCRADAAGEHILNWQPEQNAPAMHPDMMTKHFLKARAACGLFDEDAPARTLPSFHEIRSLGASLYEKEGRPHELIQALLGHTNERMTAHYLTGHGVKWAEIEL